MNPPASSRASPLLHRCADRRRSGFTRERAGPAGQYPWPFTVAVATVFAGTPPYAQTVVETGSPAKGPGLLTNVPGHSPLPSPPYSRVNPLLRQCADRRRSGFTRERAGPAAQYPWPFTVAAATVFAGKPAPTPMQTVVGAGLPAKGPGLLASIPGRSPFSPLPYSRVNPLLRQCADRRRSGFTRERAGPAGQYPWPFTVAVASVFAGKPAPTTCRSGRAREEACSPTQQPALSTPHPGPRPGHGNPRYLPTTAAGSR